MQETNKEGIKIFIKVKATPLAKRLRHSKTFHKKVLKNQPKLSGAWNWAVREKVEERPGIPETLVSSKQVVNQVLGICQVAKGGE